MTSIEKQLNLSLAFSLSLVFTLFWWLSVTTIHHLTEDYILTRLEHDTQSITQHLIVSKNDTGAVDIQVDYHAISPIYSQPNSGHYFVLTYNDRTVKSPSLDNFSFALRNHSGTLSHYETQGPIEGTILVRRFHTTRPDDPTDSITLYVAEDHTPIQRTLAVFDTLVGLFAILTLAVLYLSQRYLLRKSFKRLEPMQSALADLQKGRVTQLNPEDYPSEVTQLTLSLNQAILSANAQLQKSRQSNANLAHSLKTPLNLLYQYLEDPTLSPQLKRHLTGQVQKIHTRIENELQKSRMAIHTSAMPSFLLTDHLNDLLTSLQQLYPHIRFHIASPVQPITTLNIEKEDGFELLGNLLDNAAKFSHGDVFIRIEQTSSDSVKICIEDNGNGVPKHQLQAIQTRGYRLDETIAGHGIGLSIVKQITEAYQLHIQFKPSSHGGLQVTLVI
ncbi:MAG: sensor histidine kinase [Hydrogenovibrio sp.]